MAGDLKNCNFKGFVIPNHWPHSHITFSLLYSSEIYDSDCESAEDIPFFLNHSYIGKLEFFVLIYFIEYKLNYLMFFNKEFNVALELIEEINAKLVERRISLSFYINEDKILLYSVSNCELFGYNLFDKNSIIPDASNVIEGDLKGESKPLRKGDLVFDPATGYLVKKQNDETTNPDTIV